MKKKRSAGILLAAALVMALVFVWNTDFTAAKEKTNDVIPDNVYIGEVAVGGMTSAEAKEAVEDFSKYEKEYRERLQGLLEEIFNPEKSFTQTEIIEKCTYCDFKALCKR